MRLKASQAAEIRLGRQRAPQYEEGEHLVPYLRSANITDGAVSIDDVKTMNFTPAEQVIFGLRDGDVLVTEGSGSRDTVGASAVWHAELDGTVCFQNTLLRMRPRPGVTEGRFVAWWARHAHASGQMAAVATGANILHLGSDGLRSLELNVPPIDEQRRIADFLDDQVSRIDHIVTARQASLRLLAHASASASRAAVLGLDGEPRAEIGLPWAREAGPGWTRRRLSHLARMGTGHTPSRSNDEYWIDCDVPWLTTADVHRFRRDEITSIDATTFQISELGLANSAAVRHPAGTVALSRTASAGFSIIMATPMATSQDFVTWTCGPDLAPRFLLGTLRVMRDYLLRYLAMGSTHKTIYFPDLQDLVIPVPDRSRQRRIGEQLDQIDETSLSHRHAVENQIALLLEYKQSLITAAVSGEFDVTTSSGRSIPV